MVLLGVDFQRGRNLRQTVAAYCVSTVHMVLSLVAMHRRGDSCIVMLGEEVARMTFEVCKRMSEMRLLRYWHAPDVYVWCWSCKIIHMRGHSRIRCRATFGCETYFAFTQRQSAPECAGPDGVSVV